MSNSAILELVIGLVFIFSLMAILVTQINTLVTNALNLRASNLKESLTELVSDKLLQAEVMVHPLVKLVDPKQLALMSLEITDHELADTVLAAELTRTADIPPAQFVEALSGILSMRAYGTFERSIRALSNAEDRDLLLRGLAQIKAAPSEELLLALRQRIQAIAHKKDGAPPPKAQLRTLALEFDALRTSFLQTGNNDPQMAPLLMGIAKVQNPTMRQALNAVIHSSATLGQATAKLERWFEDGMARSSALFRDKLQKLSLITGMLLVLVLNVDTLSIAGALWDDPALRAAIALSAQQQADANTPPPVTDPIPGLTNPPVSTLSLITDARAAQITAQQVLSLGVPIGWNHLPVTEQMRVESAALGLSDPYLDGGNLWNLWPLNGNPHWMSLLLGKIVGLLASAIAAAQGAPFWFDFLRRLTSPRGSSASSGS